jgi:membrane dipeptidase
MFLVDAHEDIAWNILRFNRDYTRSAAELRTLEEGTNIPKQNGTALLGREDWVRGQVGIIFSTLFSAPARYRLGDWDVHCYQNTEEAHLRYWENLEAYRNLTSEHPNQFRLILNKGDLNSVKEGWDAWGGNIQYAPPIGLVVLMEGAEGIRQPGELPEWYEAGVRIIGLTWVGTQYAGGTREPGPITGRGRELLKEMARLNMILDISHLAEEAAFQAVDSYKGALIASHSNAGALLPGSLEPDRHLPDDLIRKIVERHGVIGLVPYNEYLDGAWRPGTPREGITLKNLVAQIDHVCQIAGDSFHTGIGSDFDGGFGRESVPVEIDSVADMPLIGDALRDKGYRTADVEAILGRNWLKVLQGALPE